MDGGIIYNCSLGVFVYDLGEVVYGVGDVRLCTEVYEGNVGIRLYQGRKWNFPDKLVFNCMNESEAVSEAGIYEKGCWEQMILEEALRIRV